MIHCKLVSFLSFQYNIEKKANDEDEDDDDSDFEGSKKALEDDLDGMACKFLNLFIPKYSGNIQCLTYSPYW